MARRNFGDLYRHRTFVFDTHRAHGRFGPFDNTESDLSGLDLEGPSDRAGDRNGYRAELRSFAHLHRDTRERGGWEEGKGPIFGFWDWNGAHGTPSGMNRLRTMAAVGAESSMHSFETGAGTPTPALSPEEREYAEKNGMLTFFLGYQLSMGKHSLGGKDWDPKKPEEMQQALIEWIVPATVDFLAAWPEMLSSFLDWIANAVGPIAAQLVDWALALVAWIAPPSIWFSTPSGLMTSPTSTATTMRRTRTSASPRVSRTVKSRSTTSSPSPVRSCAG